jgi:putative RNA 2'-phosphotransferase
MNVREPQELPAAADPEAEAELTTLSKLLSKVLRHEPELVGIELDAQGWTSIDELIRCLAKAASAPDAPKRLRTLPAVARETLAAVVATNSKQRFAISADGTRIRALQGHSVPVDLGHPLCEPPPVLFHGTAAASWPAISREGLRPGTRHAVHLSSDPSSARAVGSRHGRPIVLVVTAAQMHADGFKFSRSDNGVWLVSEVPPTYLKKLR